MSKLILRVISLCMAVVIAGMAIACGDVGDAANGTKSQPNDDVSAETSDEALSAPDLPATDMDGKVFNILEVNWMGYEPLSITDINVTEINGEILNDTAHKRRTEICDKYNCDILSSPVANPTDGTTALNTTIMAGENAYDIALIRSNMYNTQLTAGNLCDLELVPYIDITAEYYDTQSYDALAIMDRHYGIVSNLSMNPYLLIFCAYFNKVLIDDYNLDNVYELVRNGEWTIDKMYEMGKAVASPDNSEGYDSEDVYGFTYVGDVSEGLVNAAGVQLARLAKDGTIELTYDNELSVTKMQHILDLLKDKNTSFNIHTRPKNGADTYVIEVGMFMQRKTLFSLAGIYYAPQFREMQDDYGIIPLPKYDEAQADYYSPIFSNPFPITVIPVTNDNLEYTGILLEEMSYRGYTELLPALYDTVLTGKCARDDDSVEMLDIIFNNKFYDIGMIFDFGGVRTELRSHFDKLDDNLVSGFESIRPKVEANIQSLLEAVENID